MEKFVVSYAPFARSTNDTNKMFLYISTVLVLPAVFGAMFFGIQALFVLLVIGRGCAVSWRLERRILEGVPHRGSLRHDVEGFN